MKFMNKIIIGFLLFLIACHPDKNAIELNNIACNLIVKGQYDSAKVLLIDAIKIDSTYNIAYNNLISVYDELNDTFSVLRTCEKLLKVKPKLAEAWMGSGFVYYKYGDSIKSNSCFKKSLDLFNEQISNLKDTKFINANRINKAVCLILLSKDSDGRFELRKLLKDCPEDSNIIRLFLNMSRDSIINLKTKVNMN